MANVIKLKRGSGSDPTANDLVVGEVAVRTDTGKLFTKKDNGTIAEISGAGGSDIFINTLSASSGSGGGSATFNGTATRFTLSNPPDVSAQQLLVSVNGVVQKPNAGTSPSTGFAVDGNDIIFASAPETGASFFIVTYGTIGLGIPADGSVTTGKIADGAIVNADVNASAAIAGSKINPNFGSQDISTTGNLTLFGTNPTISFTDSNEDSDFRLFINAGKFKIQDASNSNADRFTVFTDGHIDIPGELNLASDLNVTGNVGIGTTSPSALIHASLAAENGSIAQFGLSGQTNNQSFIIKADDSDSLFTFRFGSTNSTYPAVRFNMGADAEAMRIDSSGRVLIGTTTEGHSNADDLTIATSGHTGISLRSGTSSNGSVFFSDGTSGADEYRGWIQYTHTTDYLTFGTNASERMRIDSSGHVGIGMTPSGVRLDVQSSVNDIARFTGPNSGGITIRNDTSNEVQIHSGNSDALIFGTNGENERMRIDSSGRVGIGTSSPATVLHLDASGGAVLRMQRIATNATNKLEFSHDGTDGTIDSTNDLIFRTGGGIKATLTDTGNLGIGTTSPNRNLMVMDAIANEPQIRIETSDGGSKRLDLFVDSSAVATISAQQSAQNIAINARNQTIFSRGGFGSEVESMRINASGGLMIGDDGTTRIGEPKLHILSSGSNSNCASFFHNTTHDRDAIIVRHNGADGGNNRIMIKLANADGNAVGNIISNGSSTSYNTSSDYRLKENVTAISDGITRLKTLKPYRFNFKADASTIVDGFFAHEVTAVPEAVTGTKDEVDSDNNPIYQGIDQSKLVPLLTAALQEAIGKIETLETKVAALEAG